MWPDRNKSFRAWETMAVNRPVLFLDIDGVLCPFGIQAESQYEPIPNHEFALWCPEHTEWLRELRESYELVWATFWEREANKVLSPLHELGTLPYIEFEFDLSTFRDYAKTPKLASIQRWAGNHPCVWIDDDLQEDAFTWASERDKVTPTLLIQTDPSEGLNESVMDQLREWV